MLKILLFPVSPVLSVLVSMGRLITTFSGVLLGIIAVVCFLVGVASMVLLGESFRDIWQAFLLAWLLSPFGLPYFAGFLVEMLDTVNDAIKDI